MTVPVSPPRWVALQGTANTRDLGGRRGPDGRVVRDAVLLRSDNLQDLTGSDVRHLVDDLGVRTVIDLRTDGERRSEGPGPLSKETVRHLELSVVPEVQGPRVLPDRRREDPVKVYLGYLADAPEVFRAAFDALADPAAGAGIVHCAAGKDRTGVLVALLLSCLGVDRAEILADYEASDERVEAVIGRLAATRTYRRDVLAVPARAHAVRAEVLGAVLAELDERYGGPCGWVQEVAQVTAATLGALRDRLLTPQR